MAEKSTFSRQGTARALLLLASGLAVAGAVVVCFVALVFGSSLPEPRWVVLGTATFGVFVLVSAIVANLFAARAKSLGGVVGRGCGTLLAGIVLGVAAMLLLISKIT